MEVDRHKRALKTAALVLFSGNLLEIAVHSPDRVNVDSGYQ